jgi:hypothetical protein
VLLVEVVAEFPLGLSLSTHMTSWDKAADVFLEQYF